VTIRTERHGGRISFSVRVIPRASANVVGGFRADALVVRVTAPPVGGAANVAVRAALAKALHVAPGLVRIERGGAAPLKVVSVPASAGPRIVALV
jgi:uncharacterized protein YggU (UPF0235/DUF167 family)